MSEVTNKMRAMAAAESCAARGDMQQAAQFLRGLRQPTEAEIDLARRHGTDGSEPRSADEYCVCCDCRRVRRWDHEQLNQETSDV